MITNEQFLADLERDHPGQDWNNVPDPETLPDIYVVQGEQWMDRPIYCGPRKGQTDRRKNHFEVGAEFPTMEEAQAQIEKCKTWEGIIPETLKIVPMKPSAAVWLFFSKECKEAIERGEKPFPMYLP